MAPEKLMYLQERYANQYIKEGGKHFDRMAASLAVAASENPTLVNRYLCSLIRTAQNIDPMQ